MSVQIIQGDCREALKTLPGASVQCCVTSPPYFGLRSYLPDADPLKPHEIGLEETPDAYVANMVAVFREVRRVLRDDAVLWLNLGDSYCSTDKWGGGGNVGKHTVGVDGRVPSWESTRQKRPPLPGLKPKDLIGIPWRVAFALQADGWWLRGDHIWAKPNGMPESVQDRPTRGHEYVFLLSKSEKYFYDAAAVRTAPKPSTITRLAQNIDAQEGSERADGGGKTNGPMKAVGSDKQRGHSCRHTGFNERWDAMDREQQMAGGANLRSVWWVPPAQFKEAHFAVMPDMVAEICICAGTREGDTVLDPFGGAGTTALMADRLQRNAISIELSPEFARLQAVRLEGDNPLFASVS
jgi:DNA modification methylase